MMTNFELPTINYDVVIVGGGISGLTLACGLRSSGLRILVVEAQQQQQATERCLRRASPTRAYALSPIRRC